VNAWHLSNPDLAAYAAGSAGTVLTASVETHLVGCGECRAALTAAGGATTRANTEQRWAALVEELDRPVPGVLDRVTRPWRPLLSRASVSSRPLLVAWLAAMGLLLGLPVLPVLVIGTGAATVLLAVAPLAPMIAVVLAYHQATDPAGELALATPVAGFRLVATRALAVALAAAPVGVVEALVLGLPSYVAFGWLLPGLALSALVLAAGTIRLDPAVAAGVLGGAWALAIALPTVSRLTSSDLVAQVVASPDAQLLTLAVAVTALALAFARRDHVTYRRTA
jgi:hypothetical protein